MDALNATRAAVEEGIVPGKYFLSSVVSFILSKAVFKQSSLFIRWWSCSLVCY